MPLISVFFGINVRMYFADHPPPHIHVEYQGQEAVVEIAHGQIIAGAIPRRAAALMRQWCVERRGELAQNWERAQTYLPLQRISGADHD